MFDRGMAALGGMRRFVKPGQTVVVKPNVSWDASPELGGNTNPQLVSQVVRHCLDAGAGRVTVVDHNIENGRRCYQSSGIADAATSSGAVVAPAEAERYYQATTVPGKSLKRASVHEAILAADVFINIPILKHHGGAGMTAGMKNLMGAVWDRRFYHANNLNQCIADFLTLRQPDLNILDCYRVMTRNGPKGGSAADIKLVGMQLISTDIVAVDAAASRILGRAPEDFPYVGMAYGAGLGEVDLARLMVERLTL
jgi:uncharacterized protein (DUF362 family)